MRPFACACRNALLYTVLVLGLKCMLELPFFCMRGGGSPEKLNQDHYHWWPSVHPYCGDKHHDNAPYKVRGGLV